MSSALFDDNDVVIRTSITMALRHLRATIEDQKTPIDQKFKRIQHKSSTTSNIHLPSPVFYALHSPAPPVSKLRLYYFASAHDLRKIIQKLDPVMASLRSRQIRPVLLAPTTTPRRQTRCFECDSVAMYPVLRRGIEVCD